MYNPPIWNIVPLNWGIVPSNCYILALDLQKANWVETKEENEILYWRRDLGSSDKYYLGL